MASFELSFRARTAAALVALTGVTLVAASSFVAGCSSSSDTVTPDAATSDCPTTIPSALANSSCSFAREACIVGFICPGEINETATCTCGSLDSGPNNWLCVDHSGAPITDPEAGTNCTNLGGGNDSQCPSTESAASFVTCQTSGLICSYQGQTCPGSKIANTDTCQCNGAPDGGLQFQCEPQSCLGPPTDSGTFSTDAGDK